ncbi:hypothetical protein JW979_00095, partial [bacterium]|nr:hypothetical protein [candidate division CSSED10-310 bacterium]
MNERIYYPELSPVQLRNFWMVHGEYLSRILLAIENSGFAKLRDNPCYPEFGINAIKQIGIIIMIITWEFVKHLKRIRMK